MSEGIDCLFDLGAKVGHVKGGFVDDLPIVLAVPPQSVLALLRSGLL